MFLACRVVLEDLAHVRVDPLVGMLSIPAVVPRGALGREHGDPHPFRSAGDGRLGRVGQAPRGGERPVAAVAARATPAILAVSEANTELNKALLLLGIPGTRGAGPSALRAGLLAGSPPSVTRRDASRMAERWRPETSSLGVTT